MTVDNTVALEGQAGLRDTVRRRRDQVGHPDSLSASSLEPESRRSGARTHSQIKNSGVSRSSVKKIDDQTKLFEQVQFRRWAAVSTLVQDDFAAVDSAGDIIGRITLFQEHSPSIWLWHIGIELSVANGSAFSFENAKSALQFAWTGHKASTNAQR